MCVCLHGVCLPVSVQLSRVVVCYCSVRVVTNPKKLFCACVCGVGVWAGVGVGVGRGVAVRGCAPGVVATSGGGGGRAFVSCLRVPRGRRAGCWGRSRPQWTMEPSYRPRRPAKSVHVVQVQ